MIDQHPLTIHLRRHAEPRTTAELEDETGYTRGELGEELPKLLNRGVLGSKEINGECVWWATPDEGSWDASQNSLLHKFFESSPTGLALINDKETVIFANKRLEEIFGIPQEELLGTTICKDWKAYRDDGTKLVADECPVKRTLRTGDAVFGEEFWLEFDDGREKWVLSNVMPVIEDDEGIEYVLVCFEDLTDIKHREEKLTSDDSRYLKLTSDQVIQPFLSRADDNPQINVDEVVRTHDAKGSLQYVTVEGISGKAAKDVFEANCGINDVRLIKRVGDKCRLELATEAPTLPLLFDEYGGQIHALVDTQDPQSPCIVGELPGNVDYKEVIQKGKEIYPDLELDSQELAYSPQLLYEIVADDLTDKQFSALQAAYYSGYFESPRSTNGDELAERFGISRQALNNRLRNAQETVIRHLFESSGEAGR